MLLKHILKVFPSPLNFLDGDNLFRRQQHVGDIFVDDHFLDLESLVTGAYKPGSSESFPEWDKKKVKGFSRSQKN